MNGIHSFKRRVLAALAGAVFTAAAGAQQVAERSADLSKQPFSWRLIIGGRVSGTICDTAYGFAFLSDGRTICAVSGSGHFLWQRSVKGAPTPYLGTMSDILLVVTAGDTLNLVNPSGITVWSAKAGFAITENPFAGRDGRIFVRGKNAVACYGLQGKRKWLLKTDALRTDLALTELDDGSLLAFLEQAGDGGKTRALRISAFGEVLETTTFSGYVHAAARTGYGVLVALDGGAGGLCAVGGDGTVESVWHAADIGDCRQLAVFGDGRTGAFLSQDGANATATLVSLASGERLESLALGRLALSATNQLRATDDGIYISDGTRALEFSASAQTAPRAAAAGTDDAAGAGNTAGAGTGTADAPASEAVAPAVLWEASLPPASEVSATYYTADGTLLVCRKDWVIHAYVMKQHVGEEPKAAAQKPAPQTRSYQMRQSAKGTAGTLASVERLPPDMIATMRRALSAGDYGAKERQWSALVQREMQNWLYDLTQVTQGQDDARSYFVENPVYARAIIELGAAFATADYAPLLAALLAHESRTPVCVDIIRAYALFGWDDDGAMLATIEQLLQQHRFTARDTVALKAICDTVYEVCRYMGKPALMAKGKNILAYLLYPQFDSSTRTYARKTFQRIAALQMP